MNKALCSMLVSAMLVACGSSSGGGSGTEPTQVIGPAGGKVSAPGGGSIDVPAGALGSDTAITIKQAPSDAPPLPPQIVSRGETLAFTPHGQTFIKPVTIQVPFTGDSAGVALFTADPGGAWTQVASAQVVGGTLEAEVTHFSFFAAGQAGQAGQWLTVFGDDFERADGGLGANYTTQVYPTTGSILIANNRVEFSAAGGAETFSKLLYNVAVTSNAIRVSGVFNNTTPQTGDFALTAKITLSGSDEVAYMAMLSMKKNDISIAKVTINSAGAAIFVSLASAAFTASTGTAYNLVFTVDGGKLDFAVSTGGGTPTTISATDASPLSSGKVSVNGDHTGNSKLTLDDLKIEKYE